MTDTVRVVFTPSGLSGSVPAGTTVLDAARTLGVDVDSVCGGRGVCGRCQVRPTVGSFAKWAIASGPEALSAPADTEATYEGRRPLVDGHRLGCAARLLADAVVDVPAESQVHRQVIRKSVDVTGLLVDPLVTLAYVELPAATLDDAGSAASALLDALRSQHGLAVDALEADVLRWLHAATAGGRTTAAVRGRSVVAVWPGFVDVAAGVAVDVGSTTIAAHLCDLASGDILASAGRMNPQIRFGEDLMSRVSYVMMHPGGDAELTDAVRVALDELVGELCADATLPRDRVLDVVAVGNPIMHHLLLGIDPTPLGTAPFTLATADAVHSRARDVDLDLPFASLYVGPCIAGHVGADTAAAILAEGPHRAERTQLLVDVGTNAEIVLGDRHGVWAASSPTGPAFEGAQLSCGQRATVGAIERVRIDRETLEPRLKVIGCDAWSDEPGFDVAPTGLCGSGVVEAIAELFLAGVIDADGTILGAAGLRTGRIVADGRTFAYVLHGGEGEGNGDGGRLVLTQNDVRAIQLAKAALRAGIDLLIERAGHPVVTDVRLAGAFGAHLDPLHTMVLGLVPDGPLDGVRSVGNAAGAGAVRALLSASERAEMERAVRAVTKVETATEPRFQELFVAAMAFPHATAPSPRLAEHVELPVRAARTDRRGRRASSLRDPS